MNISAIEVRNYKLCKKARIEIDRGLTALLGKNGAGKTTVLQAISLLNTSTDSTISMNTDRNYRKNEYDISTITAEITWDNKPFSFILEAYFQKDIVSERPKGSKYYLLDHTTGKKYPYQDFDLFIYTNNYLRPNYIEKKEISDELKNVYTIMPKILEYIHNLAYIETSDFLGSSNNETTIEISDRYGYRHHGSRENGQFLHDLYNLTKDSPKDFIKFKKIASRIGGGLVNDLEFKPLSLPKSSVQLYKDGKLATLEEKRRLVVPIFTIGKNKLYNNQLSEGTFRALALIFYILNHKAKLIIIEEPELSIHYELLNDLVGLIKDASSQKQVILSTHSEGIIDMLSYKNIAIVSRSDEGVIVKPLSDYPTFNNSKTLSDFLDDGGGISDLIATEL